MDSSPKENKSSDGNVKRQVADVSVDEMVNKNMAEKEWRAQSEAQMMSMDNNMRALAACAQRADHLGSAARPKPGAREHRGRGTSPDTERVPTAYQNENEQLKAALAAARQSPIMGQPAVGPGDDFRRTQCAIRSDQSPQRRPELRPDRQQRR